jgi:hypothetical protein
MRRPGVVQREMGLAVLGDGYDGEGVRADEREETMKRMGALVVVALMAASVLSGCIFVPVDGYRPYRGYGYYPRYYPGWYYGP